MGQFLLGNPNLVYFHKVSLVTSTLSFIILFSEGSNNFSALSFLPLYNSDFQKKSSHSLQCKQLAAPQILMPRFSKKGGCLEYLS